MSDDLLPWDGYPPDRELDGWHWLADEWAQPIVAQWMPREEWWALCGDADCVLPAAAVRRWIYDCPCVPPARLGG
jgi:hypothetical protein